MKKQFTITEKNKHEREVFNYIVNITPEELMHIMCKISKLGNNTLFIKHTNYTDAEIKLWNDNSKNTYMKLFTKCTLKENALENWKDFGDCFYKGVGLIEI